jgi:serine protease Do
MVSTPPLSKTKRSIFASPAARPARFGTWALVIACTWLGPWPDHRAGAAEVSAVSAAKGFADLVAKVKPAVIAVTVRLESEADFSNSGKTQAAPQSQPFSENSQPHRDLSGSSNQPAPTPQIEMALGSGFFISQDGYAVTNNHVVQRGVSFKIATDDGTIYTAKVVGADFLTDLALLKVDGHDFPYVELANREPRIGDWVIAVGNPFGLGGTVTAGIVSARGRHIDIDSYDDFIQIDAPINRGNSGGPSFNLDGNVVGVNTAIFSPSGGSVGIGFAIPTTTVKAVIRQLKEKGVVTRGTLGVKLQRVTPGIANALGLNRVEGTLVAEVQPDGPAARAGIVPGDVVLAANGEPILNGVNLAATIGQMAPGTAVKIDIFREGSERTVSVTLGELPVTPFRAAVAPKQQEPTGLGLGLAPAATTEGAGSRGVVITEVDPNGLAAEKGLAAGDVILDVSGNPVATSLDVSKAISRAQETGKHDTLMRVKTKDGSIRFVALPPLPLGSGRAKAGSPDP